MNCEEAKIHEIISCYGYDGYIELLETENISPCYEHLLSAVNTGEVELVEHILKMGIDPNDEGFCTLDQILNPDYAFDPKMVEVLFLHGGSYTKQFLCYLSPEDKKTFLEIEEMFNNPLIKLCEE